MSNQINKLHGIGNNPMESTGNAHQQGPEGTIPREQLLTECDPTVCPVAQYCTEQDPVCLSRFASGAWQHLGPLFMVVHRVGPSLFLLVLSQAARSWAFQIGTTGIGSLQRTRTTPATKRFVIIPSKYSQDNPNGTTTAPVENAAVCALV